MTNSTRYLLGICAIFGVLSVVPSIQSFAQGLGDPPGQARILALEERINNLLFLIRKLHRNSAAIREVRSGTGSTSPASSVRYFLIVCAGIHPDNECPEGSPFLQATLTVSDRGATISFNATTDADFNEIAAILTNGERDTINEFASLDTGQGIGFTARESEFFEDFLEVDGVDFAGMVIDQISLKVDKIFFATNPDANNIFRNEFVANVFYELAASQ